MKVFLSHYCAPKSGNADAEMEDAFRPKERGEITSGHLCFAVADGATEGVFSKQWAECLIKCFCEKVESDIVSLMERALKEWEIWKTNYVLSRNEDGRPLQWFEEHGLIAGAFSTLLGLELVACDDGRHGDWYGLAVGDTCLFQVHDEELIAQFPVLHSSDFSNRPFLASTNRLSNVHIAEVQQQMRGQWQRNDQFYIMTDALACWFMQMREASRNPLRSVRQLDTEEGEEFFDWISRLRSEESMRNDDVTLLRIDIV